MYALSYFEKLLSSSSDGYVNLYDINESEGGVLRQQYKEKDCTYFNIQLIQPVCSGWTKRLSFRDAVTPLEHKYGIYLAKSDRSFFTTHPKEVQLKIIK